MFIVTVVHMADDEMFQREQIFHLLHGLGNDYRFTQDSPIVPDVWIHFAQDLTGQHDVLLTPNQLSAQNSPTELQEFLDDQLSPAPGCPEGKTTEEWMWETFHPRHPDWTLNSPDDHVIACNQTTVVVRVSFDELVRVLLPLTTWWQRHLRGLLGDIHTLHDSNAQQNIAEMLASKTVTHPGYHKGKETIPPDVLWAICLIGTLSRMYWETKGIQTSKRRQNIIARVTPTEDELADESIRIAHYFEVVRAASRMLLGVNLKDPWAGQTDPPSIFQISLNRPAAKCVSHSRLSVKADAAISLFEINTSKITWAVLDDGIDARHIAFRDRDEQGNPLPFLSDRRKMQSRVSATYDFTCIRPLLSPSTHDDGVLPEAVRERLRREPRLRKELQESLNVGRTVNWDLLLPLIQLSSSETRADARAPYSPPVGEHGTHVAGILGGDWRVGDEEQDVFQGAENRPPSIRTPMQGVCPNINLLDLRVFDANGNSDEFTIMAALQFVRYLNSQSSFMKVHGVNLSLSIRHDVANYACGRTPVCNECERLVGDGVVVVTAAGNDGYQGVTPFNPLPRYHTISITDPGNAEGVITVGSTHRRAPHTYGVSYFSSRGPTGDGRMKPDLVAPGEKIDSCIPNQLSGRKDGTSMSAPHVSGAAALLMARNPELVGQAVRIKQILCDSATDLGREPYFQGSGMLDILRALQSI